MGLLTFSINVTLDGCVDHQEGIADDETRLLHPPHGRGRGDAVGPRHLRDDGELLASGRPRRRRHRRRCASGRSLRPSRSTWCPRRERTSRGPTATTSPTTCARDVQKLKDATPDGTLGSASCDRAGPAGSDRRVQIARPSQDRRPRPDPLRERLPSTRRLELISAKLLRSGAVAMHYRRAHSEIGHVAQQRAAFGRASRCSARR